MTVIKPDSLILDSLDWTPECEAKCGCDNTATHIGRVHCGPTTFGCTPHVQAEHRFGEMFGIFHCGNCGLTTPDYSEIVVWRPL